MLCRTLASSRKVLLLMAVVISQAAVAVLMLFSGQFEPSIASVDDFLEATVAMYVFMATGQNYAQLVNQVRLQIRAQKVTNCDRHGKSIACTCCFLSCSALWV